MSNADSTRKALGRGLSALLPSNRPLTPQTPSAQPAAPAAPLRVPIDDIDPNPLQPRSAFQADRLAELAQSIRQHGIIQPLIVRSASGRYQLVAGERRWRAAKMAGLAHIPVIIQDYADDQIMEVALIENIQREDLNPIEVAHAFERLTRDHELSHEQIAERTGKDRTTVTNMLRLLAPPRRHSTSPGRTPPFHGPRPRSAEPPTPEMQLHLAERISSEGLSVRQVERLVRKMTESRQPKQVEQVEPDPNVKAAIEHLERVLGTRVRIFEKSAQRERLEIEYYSMEDLHRIYEMIVGDK